MMRPVLIVIAVLAWLPVAAAGEVVYCHDAAHGTVIETLAWECEGEVVSAEEAEEIRARRQARIRAIVNSPRQVPFPQARRTGVGSGAFVTEQGHLLTASHVVPECTGITLLTADGATLTAELLRRDSVNDLALLRAEGSAPAVLPVADGLPHLASRVRIVGYPGRWIIPERASILSAAYQGTTRGRNGRTLLMLDADVTGGHSGGPVVDAAGALVGLVNSEINIPKVYAKTGRRVSETAFAVPLAELRAFLDAAGVRPAEPPGGAGGDVDVAAIARVSCWR